MPKQKRVKDTDVQLGTTVCKHFDEGIFTGCVVGRDCDDWKIIYEDGDTETLSSQEIRSVVHAESSLLRKRRRQPSDEIEFFESPEETDCLWRLHGLNKTDFMKEKMLNGTLSFVNVADFYLYCSERHRMWYRRHIQGKEAPWSKSPKLSTNRWCNVYRELDRGTMHFHSLVMAMNEKNNKPVFRLQWTRQVLWLSYAYRQVNRRQTFDEIGLPDSTDAKPFLKKMRQIQNEKRPFFTHVHQTCSYNSYEKSLKTAINDKLIDMVAAEICSEKTTLTSVGKSLRKLPGIGPFYAWQIMCDLQENGCIDFDDEFCILGPGAKSGLKIVFRDQQAAYGTETQKARVIVALQDVVWLRLGFNSLHWKGKKLTLKEVEHSLCEYSKFIKVKAKKHVFVGSDDKLDTYLFKEASRPCESETIVKSEE